MDKKVYRSTKYPGIKQNIKNGNYIVDMFINGKRSSVSTIDGKRNGEKILDIKTARKIQNDPTIQKRFTYSINNKTTVSEAFEKYIYDAEHNMNLAPRTLISKKNTCNLYLIKKYGKKKLFSITKEDMLQVKIEIDERNNTSSSKYGVLRDIKAFFNWLVRNKIIDESPLAEIRQFKKEKVIHKIWTPSEVEKFRKECEKDFNDTKLLKAYKARMIHLLVNLDYSLSARIGEIRALQYSKILKDRNSIVINANIDRNCNISERTKTDTSKDVLLVPQQIIDEIEEYKNWVMQHFDVEITENTPLFCNLSTMKPYSDQVIHELFQLYTEKADNPKMVIYNLRHSGVALMQELGVPLDAIQNRVRHKNIETTIDTYGSISSKTKQKIVEDISKFF